MFNLKSVTFFLLTMFFVALSQFQGIRANSGVQPQLINQLAPEQRLTNINSNQSTEAKENINQGESLRSEIDDNNQDSREIYNLYRQGKYQKVIQILSPQKELKPAQEYILATAYQNIGQFSLAVQYWSRAKESFLKKENYALAGYCLLQLAQGYIQLGRTSDAISVVQNWSYPLPDYASAIIGNAYLATGKFAEAIAYYQETLTKELKSEQRLAILNNLGSGYEKLAFKMEKSAQAIKRVEEKKNSEKKLLKHQPIVKRLEKKHGASLKTFLIPVPLKPSSIG